MIRQRRLAKAYLKEGFCANDSARALMSELPMAGSLAQKGTKPQRIQMTSRLAGSATKPTFCPGATL